MAGDAGVKSIEELRGFAAYLRNLSGNMVEAFTHARQEMYRVNARAAARTGQKMFIGLLTLTDEQGRPLTGRLRNRAMDHLQKTLLYSLRRGDVVARFSGSQYVVMIATRNYDNGLKVVGRIAVRYRSEYRGGNARLTTTLQPIDMLEE